MKIGIIGGSGVKGCALLQENGVFDAANETIISTEHGCVCAFVGKIRGADNAETEVVFVKRHGAVPGVEYSPPHKLNHRAVVAAFAKTECELVIGFSSVGSLREDIALGSVVVPDDYFCPSEILSMSDGFEAHHVPEIAPDLRERVLEALKDAGISPLLDTGVYLQTRGPRFETKAEIRVMQTQGWLI